jgi:hypothetical protein
MSSVVPTDEQRIYCLERALAINPENQSTKRSLAKLKHIHAEAPPLEMLEEHQSYQENQVSLTSLHCKNCNAPIEPDQIIPHLAMVKCAYCGATFSIAGLPLADYAREHLKDKRHEIPIAKGITVARGENTLQISYRWFNPRRIGYLVYHGLFSLAFNGFNLLVLLLLVALGGYRWVLFGCFLLPLFAGGVFLIYIWLSLLLNHTTVQVKGDSLEVHHRPLPWFWIQHLTGSLSIKTIQQIYCKKASDNTYDVYAKAHYGKVVKLMGHLQEVEQALTIERELEQYLGISDKPMEGELTREDTGLNPAASEFSL